MTILPVIQSFLNLGINVLPIRFRDKRPAFNILPTDAEGKPSWEILKKELLTTQAILSSWGDLSFLNFGVISGWKNLVILDFDDGAEYGRWVAWAMRTGGIARITAEHAYKVKTARGMHVYIRSSRNERGRKAGKIDIKAGGGYVLGAGSTHPNGTIYKAVRAVYYFPLVETLSDVLPVEMLVQEEDEERAISAPRTIPIHMPTMEELWERAMNPPEATGGVTVDMIRKEFRVEDFLGNLMSSSPDGRWWMTNCPLHEDKRPSMWVDARRQICRCFSCNGDKPMDVINLFARLYGLSNRDAIHELGRRLMDRK